MIIKKIYGLLFCAYGLTGCQPNNGGNEKIISADSSRQVDCVQVAVPEVEVQLANDSVNSNVVEDNIIGSTGTYTPNYCSYNCSIYDACNHRKKKAVFLNPIHRLVSIWVENDFGEPYDSIKYRAYIDFYHTNEGWGGLVRFRFKTCLIIKHQVLLENAEIDSFTFDSDQFYHRCNWSNWKNNKRSHKHKEGIFFRGYFLRGRLRGILYLEGRKYEMTLDEEEGC